MSVKIKIKRRSKQIPSNRYGNAISTEIEGEMKFLITFDWAREKMSRWFVFLRFWTSNTISFTVDTYMPRSLNG